MELSSPSLNNFLYIRKELAKPENRKFHIFFSAVRELFKYKHKAKRFPILSLIKEQKFVS